MKDFKLLLRVVAGAAVFATTLAGALAAGNSGQATYPDGKTRAFTNVADNEHIKSDLGLVGGSVDKPSPLEFIIYGPDKVSRVAFLRIATIAFLTERKTYTFSGTYTSQYAQVEVTTKDGKKETFLLYDDQPALHIEWSDSIAVSSYEGRDLKGVVFSLK